MSAYRPEPTLPRPDRPADSTHPFGLRSVGTHLRFGPAAALIVAGALAACSGSGDEGQAKDALDPPPGGDFELVAGGVGKLIEGDEDGLFIPLTLQRRNGHGRPVTLALSGASTLDTLNVTAGFVDAVLDSGERESGVRLSLSIDALPILPHSRRMFVTASDGLVDDLLGFDIEVRPTDAPDVYLLAGQSNMVGFSGDGTRQDYPGGADELDPRILQLNVSGNDADDFTSAEDFTSLQNNVRDPRIAIAEDPLHLPRGDVDAAGDENGKDAQYIGLGLSFAKRALLSSTADIVLVPAAWAGSSFCANGGDPRGNWNAGPVESAALGNSLMFERAVTRADIALLSSDGVLRGILWHQGESDANETCAALYADNLKRLAQQLRLRIRPDRRGETWRQANSNIPLVVGTLSRGDDERGEYSVFTEPKQQVDTAIRELAQHLSHAAVSNHDDLVPSNGYPCGSGGCIHFGADALREMGRRYHVALERAASAPSP